MFYVIQHVFINMHITYVSICNHLIVSSIKPGTGEPMTNRCWAVYTRLTRSLYKVGALMV